MTGKLTSIEGVAVPLLWDNVDTDALVPAAPHKRINGGGRDRLHEVLFHEFRFDAAGHLKPDFVLNDVQFAEGPILLAGENFGCGSSREVAVWALLDYGFRAIIAKSFAEIFEQNAYKNHLLPATVDAATHARIVSALSRPRPPQMSIDLVARHIEIDGQAIGSFSADEMGLEMIVQGVDEFALTAQYIPDIVATQRRLTEACPWLAG
ncbi:3-isopropylmalate dehydratase small subunit [Bradyrhizobium iriomotense]|uniref:3-isopropylmalate dehydratase small subunit n=1 Tax=Bradyrhizobium iriomotense TaxID=441950 RepID=UPI001B8A41EA|nr:3-isopropylmalate dehydratase small subunit [Bradyrhizobium iriomotense]MBR1129127.1 3-isopropylmalate dehydratase small subunit [Bradyrhizobium iriomotense]